MTDKTEKTLTAAVVGCGAISQHYFRTALKIDGVEIVGAIDLCRDACAKSEQHLTARGGEP